MPVAAGLMFCLEPVIAALTAAWWLGERLSPCSISARLAWFWSGRRRQCAAREPQRHEPDMQRPAPIPADAGDRLSRRRQDHIAQPHPQGREPPPAQSCSSTSSARSGSIISSSRGWKTAHGHGNRAASAARSAASWGPCWNLLRKRDSERMPPFTRVVIETTGLADPAPILNAVIGHPYLSMRYELDGVITLVDAVNGSAHARCPSRGAAPACRRRSGDLVTQDRSRHAG